MIKSAFSAAFSLKNLLSHLFTFKNWRSQVFLKFFYYVAPLIWSSGKFCVWSVFSKTETLFFILNLRLVPYFIFKLWIWNFKVLYLQESLICGSLKLLKASKLKADSTLTNGLLYLAKKYPSIFTREAVLNALCSVLRRESSLLYKAKTTYTNAVLIINILYCGYQDVKQWPEIFLKVIVLILWSI